MRRKRKKKFKNVDILFKKKYIYVIVALVLLILSYLTVINMVDIEKYFRDIILYPTKFIESGAFLEDVQREKEEENKELKELLEIKNSLTDFDIIYATVVIRNNSYWQNSMTINKGENSGIEEGMSVVDYGGLIGYVEKTSKDTSIIKLITADDKYNKIAVKIMGEEELNKILSVSNSRLVIEGINKQANIKIGDKVVTNGLSSKFPSGITVGEVVSIDRDFYNVSNILTVKPASNIENVRFVAVLKRKI